jgi:D-glycero-D-manno-heptose 1,7-bisphosphate phosphatase
VSRPGAVFVDRDGVINELVPDPVSGQPESPLRPEDVRLISGAQAALRSLADAGWRLVGVSNQPAAAKGKISLEALRAVQARVLELLASEGVRFDAFKLCLHHPDGVVPELTGACECRKPAPGMLLEAVRELGLDPAVCWIVGDTDGDVAAGRAAGCRTALVEYPGSAHKRASDPDPDTMVSSLAAAATVILAGRELNQSGD